jgi:hypothetical protein
MSTKASLNVVSNAIHKETEVVTFDPWNLFEKAISSQMGQNLSETKSDVPSSRTVLNCPSETPSLWHTSVLLVMLLKGKSLPIENYFFGRRFTLFHAIMIQLEPEIKVIVNSLCDWTRKLTFRESL